MKNNSKTVVETGGNCNTSHHRQMRWRLFALLLLLTGCSQIPIDTDPGNKLASCKQLFRAIDRTIEKAAVVDPVSYRIPGFPYLRSNRFNASFAENIDARTMPGWIARLARLDETARLIELANLKPANPFTEAKDLPQQLSVCRQQLIAADLDNDARLQQLRRAVAVPDEYSLWQRIFGIYPISALFVSMGIKQLHHQQQQAFSHPPAKRHRSQRWSSRQQRQPTSLRMPPAGNNKRAIATLDATTKAALFNRYAPVWEIEQEDDNDIPGRLIWQQGKTVVDRRQPASYQWLSYTRFQQQSLLQLNYLIWFSARPGDDIYAGHLDGLIWRVTLGPDGSPWLYDSIHSCGCYHTLFPSRALRPRQQQRPVFSEALFLPLIDSPPDEQALRIQVSAGKHFIRGIAAVAKTERWLALTPRDYNELRSLPDETGQRHGIFAADGLISGTERRERFLLWPMGIRSAGAMRSIGHQATAFIGKRHFDDARFIETYFERTDQR